MLDYNTYAQIMTKVYWNLDREEEILKCFHIFDNGGTDKISFSDLKRVAKELGENMTDEEISEMIEVCDQDKDDAISFSEFKRIMDATNLFQGML